MERHLERTSFYGHVMLLVGILIAGVSVSIRLDPPLLWLVLLALVGLVCWRAYEILRLHPIASHRRPLYTMTFLVLPALLTLGAALFIDLFSTPVWAPVSIAAGLVVAGILLAGVVIALYHTIDRNGPHYATARFLINLASYLVAFSLFAAIYDARVRSLQSATSIMILTTLLALDLFNDGQTRTIRIAFYAVLTGLILGQLTWSLNWLPLSGLAGGVCLLLAFYIVTGVVQSAFLDRLTRATVIEFAGVTIAGLVVLLGIGNWAR